MRQPHPDRRDPELAEAAGRVSAAALAGAVGTVVAAAIACALLVHHSCLHPPPPVIRPDPGTPRADYCAVVDHGTPWLAALLALVIAVPAVSAVRRQGWAAVATVTALLWLVCLVVGVTAGALTSARTI